MLSRRHLDWDQDDGIPEGQRTKLLLAPATESITKALVAWAYEQGWRPFRELRVPVPDSREHPQFVTCKNAATDTELRATMHWDGDEQRVADLNVFFVHTPT